MISTRFAPIPVALLLSALAAPCAVADQVVYFINGKAMIVKSVETGDGLTILEMEGGGRIGVPSAQIERVEEFTLSVPAAPALAAPVPNRIVKGASQAAVPALQPAALPGGAAAAVASGGPQDARVPEDGVEVRSVAGPGVAPMAAASDYARTAAPGGATPREGRFQARGGTGGRSDLGIIGRPGAAGPGSGRRLSGLLRSFSSRPSPGSPSPWNQTPPPPPPQVPADGGDTPADQGQNGGGAPQDPRDGPGGGTSSPLEDN